MAMVQVSINPNFCHEYFFSKMPFFNLDLILAAKPEINHLGVPHA
jgi:hypothetical protein